MKGQNFTVSLLLALFYLSHIHARESMPTEIACIDDSDCVKLGHKYSCFLYYCHNWVDPNPEKPHCQADWQCDEGHKCYRHWNLREVDNGICYTNYQTKTCDKHSDCQAGDYCCGMYCCPQHYYRQWKDFSCFSDIQCRSWKTGNYCCNNNLCCDDRKVEIQAFGIDADLDTNELSEVIDSSEETETSTDHDYTDSDLTLEEEHGSESMVNTVLIDPEATTHKTYQETTESEKYKDTTLQPDFKQNAIIKDSITVNVSSFDLYQSDDTNEIDDDATMKSEETIPVHLQTDDISSSDSEYKTTLNDEYTAAVVTTEASIIDNDDYEEIKDEYDDEDYTTIHDSTTLHNSGEHGSESTTLNHIETSTLTIPTESPKIQPTIAGVTVDKYGRPKNGRVHSFSTSGATVHSVTLCTSNIIKSIGLMFIQLKMISNSFSGCYNLS